MKQSGLKFDKKKSWGDEYYTRPEIVEMIAKDYRYIFDQYDFIWLPFNSEDKPMYSIMKKHYGDKIITNQKSTWDGKIYNFFLFKDDYDFLSLLNNNKVLVYDNPPFSIFSKIVLELNASNELFGGLTKDLDYILFADTITGLNKIKGRTTGYHILNRILFDCERTDTDDTCVNVGLFSNLFTDVRCHFFDCRKNRLHCRKIDWTDKVNQSLFMSCNCLSSARILNYAQRGIVFRNLPQAINRAKQNGFNVFGGSGVWTKEEKVDMLEECGVV